MAKIERELEPEQARQSARHTLFVEGDFDNVVLTQLLKDTDIPIKPLGFSSDIRNVARALRFHHPDYYFLIDRDHQDQATVDSSWQNFPDLATDNLLIWRCREIENYFLKPEYLGKSEHLTCSIDELKVRILEAADQRILLDIANLVILQLKKELRQDLMQTFHESSEVKRFRTHEEALQRLLLKHQQAIQACDTLEKLQSYPISNHFHKMVNTCYGPQDTLEFGRGSWLEMVKGKHVLRAIVNTCFNVKDNRGKLLPSNKRLEVVARSLVKTIPLAEQPEDFRELHRLISARMRPKAL